ncbi:MAG: oligosaccharide flippase family protein [candidate division WOR-3 bacterium]
MNLILKLKANLNDRHFGEVLKGSIFTFISRGFSGVFALLLQVIIVRAYGTEVLGLTELINSFLMIMVVFPLMGNHISILRFIPEYTGKNLPFTAFRIYRKLLYFIIIVSILLVVIVVFNSHFIVERVFKKPQYLTLFLIAGFFIPFRALYEYSLSAIRALRLIKTFAFFQILPVILNLIILGLLTILFYQRYNPIYSFLSGFLIASLAGSLIAETKLKRLKAESSNSSPSKLTSTNIPPSLSSLLSVSIPMFLANVMNYINNQTGVLILGALRSEKEIAYYAVAAKFAALTSFLLIAINSMIAPKFAELYHAGKMDDLRNVIRKSTKLIFWSTVPILTGLLLLGRPLLSCIYGDELLLSYIPLVVLLSGEFINSISGSVGFFLLMTGNERTASIILLFASIINISLSVLLVPYYGATGAAIGATFSTIFWNLAMVWVIRSKYKITFIYSPIRV